MTAARFASVDDVPRILEILAKMHAESRYAEWPIDPDKLQQLVHGLIDHEDGACLVAQDSGEIIGVMLGLVTEFFFSRERMATELLLYVVPGKRGSWAAVRLAHRFIEWAGATDAVEIQAGVSAGIANKDAERFYSSLGFASLGLSFSKVLDHVRA
jgi:GNAT superfamily N-acetyltransferase